MNPPSQMHEVVAALESIGQRLTSVEKTMEMARGAVLALVSAGMLNHFHVL